MPFSLRICFLVLHLALGYAFGAMDTFQGWEAVGETQVGLSPMVTQDVKPGLPLSQWLPHLQVPMPGVTLKLPIAMGQEATLEVLSGTCVGLNLKTLSFPFVAATPSKITAGLHLGGVVLANCTVDAITSYLFLKSELKVSFRLLESSVGIVMDVDMDGTATPLPTAISLRADDGCNMDLHIGAMTFLGDSTLAGLMNTLLVPFLKTEVGRLITNAELCRVALELVAVNGTHVVKNLAQTLRPALQPQSPTATPSFQGPVIDIWELSKQAILRTPIDMMVSIFGIGDSGLFSDSVGKCLSYLGVAWPPAAKGPHSITLPVSAEGIGDIQLQMKELLCESFALASPNVSVTQVTSSLGAALGLQCGVEVGATVDFDELPSLSLDSVSYAVDMKNMDIQARTVVALSPSMANLYIDQMQMPSCVVRGLVPSTNYSGLGILNYGVSLDRLSLTAAPSGKMDPIVVQILAAIPILQRVLSGSLAPTVGALVNGQHALDSLTGLGNKVIDTYLKNAPPCPGTDYSTGENPVWGFIVRALCAVIGAAVALTLVAMASSIMQRRLRKPRGPLRPPTARDILDPQNDAAQTDELGPATAVNPEALSNLPLYRLPQVSRGMKILIPLLITLNVSIFVMVDSIVVGNVLNRTQTGEEVGWYRRISASTVFVTTEYMVDHGCWFLALLLILWSVAWPIVKLLTCYLCWFAPGSILSCSRRGWLLVMLDQVGKYSLFDAFLLTQVAAGVKFDWSGPSTLPGADGSQLMGGLVLTTGYYLMIFATMMSLMCGEILLYVHRFWGTGVGSHNLHTLSTSMHHDSTISLPKGGARDDEPAAEVPEHSLHTQEPEELKVAVVDLAGFSTVGRVTVGSAIAAILIMLIIGVYLPCMGHAFGGVMGDMMMMGGRTDSVSLNIPQWLMSMKPTILDVGFFEIAFRWVTLALWWMVIVIAPVVYIILLAIVFFVPLTSNTQFKLFVYGQIVGAWAMLDVAVFSVLVGVVGGDVGLEFFVNQMMVSYGVSKPMCTLLTNTLGWECFVFVPTLHAGAWFLTAGSIGLNAITIYLNMVITKVQQVALK